MSHNISRSELATCLPSTSLASFERGLVFGGRFRDRLSDTLSAFIAASWFQSARCTCEVWFGSSLGRPSDSFAIRSETGQTIKVVRVGDSYWLRFSFGVDHIQLEIFEAVLRWC